MDVCWCTIAAMTRGIVSFVLPIMLGACRSQPSAGDSTAAGNDRSHVVEPPAQGAVGAYAVQGARPLELVPLPPEAPASVSVDAGALPSPGPRSGVAL